MTAFAGVIVQVQFQNLTRSRNDGRSKKKVESQRPVRVYSALMLLKSLEVANTKTAFGLFFHPFQESSIDALSHFRLLHALRLRQTSSLIHLFNKTHGAMLCLKQCSVMFSSV